MLVHLNGELVAASEARLDPADRGLTLGDGLFETILARDSAPVRLAAHLARLEAGAAVLGMPVPISKAALTTAVEETLSANAISHGVLRLTLTRGPARRGLLPPDRLRPTLLITAEAADGMPPSPVSAVIAASTRRNEHSPLCRCKCISYLDNVLARMEADKRGADEAILLNTAGGIAETAAANLFLVIDGRAVTPPVADGALPGIMRAEVIGRVGAEERSLGREDLRRASEAFITNSLGIRPLLLVDGMAIADGRPGALTERLRAWFLEAVIGSGREN
jgi:branched-chain amino acid aminotransferase